VSDWKVNLEMIEGGSSKFWRARVEGTTLFVNFGRIGTNGQTQLKKFDSPEAAEKELESLEKQKRKKGYADAGATLAASLVEAEDVESEEEEGDEEEEAEAPAPAPKAAPKIVGVNLTLEHPGRKVETRLVQEGATVRLVAVERYASPAEAQKALDRLKAALEAEGYRTGQAREI